MEFSFIHVISLSYFAAERHATTTWIYLTILYIVLQLQVRDWVEAIKCSTVPNRKCLPGFSWTWGETTISLLAIFSCIFNSMKYGSSSVVSTKLSQKHPESPRHDICESIIPVFRLSAKNQKATIIINQRVSKCNLLFGYSQYD